LNGTNKKDTFSLVRYYVFQTLKKNISNFIGKWSTSPDTINNYLKDL